MKHLLVISLVLVVSGCSLFQPRTAPVEIKTITLPAPMYHPPMPLEVNLTMRYQRKVMKALA